MSVATLGAGAGGLATLVSALLPWATRTTVIFGDHAEIPIRAWSQVPMLLFGIVALAALVVADATSRFVKRRSGSRRQATLFAVAGSMVALSVILWAVIVLARTDPAAAMDGFEPSRSRMLPSFGAGLALLGGLLTVVAGVVGRVVRSAR
jgi:hypothetical protein